MAALFDALDAATVVRLLACVLCERRIVLRGSVHAQLLAAAEAVMALAHPYVIVVYQIRVNVFFLLQKFVLFEKSMFELRGEIPRLKHIRTPFLR